MERKKKFAISKQFDYFRYLCRFLTFAKFSKLKLKAENAVKFQMRKVGHQHCLARTLDVSS